MEATEKTMLEADRLQVRAAVNRITDNEPDDRPSDQLAEFILENEDLNLTHEQVVAVIEGMKAEWRAGAGHGEKNQEDSIDHAAALAAQLNAIDPLDVLKLVILRDHDPAVRMAAIDAIKDVFRQNAIHYSPDARRGKEES